MDGLGSSDFQPFSGTFSIFSNFLIISQHLSRILRGVCPLSHRFLRQPLPRRAAALGSAWRASWWCGGGGGCPNPEWFSRVLMSFGENVDMSHTFPGGFFPRTKSTQVYSFLGKMRMEQWFHKDKNMYRDMSHNWGSCLLFLGGRANNLWWQLVPNIFGEFHHIIYYSQTP